MTTSRRRRRPRSQALGPLEDDDLLSEILLRLPPQPSSLPRASAVCNRWRHLVSDPAFSRRFRIHHRRNPPLPGFFHDGHHGSFRPILEAPDRIPPERFSLPFDDGDRFSLLGCRHGLLLISHASWKQVLVWDPVTGDQHRIAFPPGFGPDKAAIHGAVLRAARDGRCFQVVLIAGVQRGHGLVLACVYSSETGAWGGIISQTIYLEDPVSNRLMFYRKPAVLVGNSLFFWLLVGNLVGILEFDLERQILALIRVPIDTFGKKYCNFWVMPADAGGLGALYVSDIVQLWKRKTDCNNGVASWVLGGTIEMDKLLHLHKEEKGSLTIKGFAEDNNVVFMSTASHIFMVQLETLQFKKLLKTSAFTYCHPFESVYTTGT